MPIGSTCAFSLGMVEDMLAARGIIVSHQTVRVRAEKFGRHFASKAGLTKPSIDLGVASPVA